jgi:dTMP kinase
MATPGKIIALEGIDGSGKGTQLDLLVSALEARNLPTFRISFPRYGTFFGKLVGRYLNGEFGPLEAVDPHLSALLYAGDRLEAKPEIEAALAAGKIVIADRYIGSNLAHQTARVPTEMREEFIGWLKHLEYVLYGLPAEDLVIYLRVSFETAYRLVGLKAARDYTNLKRDIQEADTKHLEQTGIIYQRLVREPNWVGVDCEDESSRKLRSPEEIHQFVMQCVESQILERL